MAKQKTTGTEAAKALHSLQESGTLAKFKNGEITEEQLNNSIRKLTKFDNYKQILNRAKARAEYAQKYEPEFGDYFRELLAGATFEFGDEVEAGLFSAFGPQTYEGLKRQIEGERKQFQKERPGAATAMQVAGGVLPAFIPGAGLGTAGRIGQLARSALTPGAPVGKGISTALSYLPGVGGLAATTPVRLGTQAAVEAGIVELGKLGDYTRDQKESALTNILLSAGFGGTFGTVIGGVGKYIGRKIQGNKTGAAKNLNNKIEGLRESDLDDVLVALDNGMVEPQDLRTVLADFKKSDLSDEVTFFDLVQQKRPNSNPLLRQTQRGIESGRGLAAMSKIDERQANDVVKDRVVGQMDKTVGKFGRLDEDAIELAEEAGRQKARPLYNEAYPQLLQPTDNINNFMNLSYTKQAMKARRPDLEVDDVFETPDPVQRGLNNIQQSMQGGGLRVADLDKAKRAVEKTNRLIQRGEEKTLSKLSNPDRMNKIIQRALADADTQVDAYGKARSAFEESRGMNAFDEGKRLMNQQGSTRKIKKFYNDLKTQLDKDSFKSGILANLIDKVMSVQTENANVAKIFNNELQSSKLKAVFTDSEVAALRSRMGLEKTMAQTGKIKAGSPTFPMAMDGQRENLMGRAVEGMSSPIRAGLTLAANQAQKLTDADIARRLMARQRQAGARQAQLNLMQGSGNVDAYLNALENLRKQGRGGSGYQDRFRQAAVGASPFIADEALGATATGAGALAGLLF